MATLMFAKTDLKGEINIDFGTFSEFTDMSAQLQERYLLKLLGFELYVDLGSNEEATKYTNLISGIAAGWTDGTYYYQLKGLDEMLTYFFYYEYQKQLQTFQTTIGEFEGLAENAGKPENKGSLTNKMVNAYNYAYMIYQQQIAYIEYQRDEEGDDYYPGFQPTEIYKENSFGIY